MKKITFLLAAALFSLASTAQEQPTIYGVNLGGTLSNLKLDNPAYKTSSSANFELGVSMEIPVLENLAIFGHLNYNRKSYKMDYENTYTENETVFISKMSSTETATFLNIPIGIRYYIGEKRNFFINVGGYVDLYLSRKTKMETGSSFDSGIENASYKETMAGIFPGIGYRLPLSAEEGTDLLFELKYNMGLTQTFDGLDGAKLNSTSLSVSYRIDWSD
ncbi:porin family protein [Flavobacterium psychrotrophum]|uniref:porin family protein n=1 Tax=Flavobacterium psychrotrophum TaxID=2294119 RepID=UPI000E319BBE|nr:porin family protein [Flavobacterium psychrotrophum]